MKIRICGRSPTNLTDIVDEHGLSEIQRGQFAMLRQIFNVETNHEVTKLVMELLFTRKETAKRHACQ